MQAVLEVIPDRYDLVVVDTPPTVVSDAMPILDYVGGVVVVGRIGLSTDESLIGLREQLDQLDAADAGGGGERGREELQPVRRLRLEELTRMSSERLQLHLAPDPGGDPRRRDGHPAARGDREGPKPMVAIGDKPILWHIMKIYGHHGFDRFVLCLGYKSWVIKQYFLRYREHVSRLHDRDERRSAGRCSTTATATRTGGSRCAETGLHTATGARLWRVRDYVDTETFMFTYGDGLGERRCRARCSTSTTRRGGSATVTGVHPTSRYGEMRVRRRRA